MRRYLVPSLLLTLAFAAPASAEVAHTVQPGETLWSIAAANNLTTRTVAAYNGLSEDAQVVLGSTIMVPTVEEGYAALQSAGLAASGTATAAAAPSGGGYTVQPGDTLSGIAARAGVSVADLAAANGLDPNGIIVAGSSLSVAGGSASSGSSGGGAAPAVQGAYTVRPGDTLSALAAGRGRLGRRHGRDERPRPGRHPRRRHAAEAAERRRRAGAVRGARARAGRAGGRPRPDRDHASAPATSSPSRRSTASPPRSPPRSRGRRAASTTAMVSSANARGVMQVMPGTWDYVQQNLAQRPLDPNSATDNVHAGVMYLKQLLNQTGGDENAAIAGYYQGLSSVQNRGMYDDTQRYVANVQALRGRFGG